MKLDELRTVEQIEGFLNGTQAVVFEVASDTDARYRWIEATLSRFRYGARSRREKGILIRYVTRVSGYSRQQVTRLIRQYRDTGRLRRRPRTARPFARRYTDRDIELLARIDQYHDHLNGLAVKKLCERAWLVFGQSEYRRLAGISVSHVYNLRRSRQYRGHRLRVSSTRARSVALGERRRPRANGSAGYLRVDTVHQGDQDGCKGVYHINAVDETTQFQMIAAVERISERHLMPALELLLQAFPFEIRGFHSDNGSEFVNAHVVSLLQKLHAEFTKSRPRHCNDNALAECKNGHVLRKCLGHGHIPQRWAETLNDFHRRYLNPYVNFHRPCLFAHTVTDARGRQRRRYLYRDVTTPYEKLKSLPKEKQALKPGVTFEQLDAQAYAMSDLQAARQLRDARRRLFQQIHPPQSARA